MRSRIKAFRKPKIVSFYPFLNLKNFVTIRTGRCLSKCVDGAFKSTKELDLDILGLMDKCITPVHCRFLLSNPHKGPSLYYVPKSNHGNNLILFWICFGNFKFIGPSLVFQSHPKIGYKLCTKSKSITKFCDLLGKWKPQEKIVHEKVKDDPVTAHFIQQCSSVSAKYIDTGIPNISLSAFSRRPSFCAGIIFQ